MCGRYMVSSDQNNIEMINIVREVQSKVSGEQQLKTGEIFPTNLAPVITADGAVPMSWGFPRWNGGGAVINARAETAAEKQMFRKALFIHRLAVPSTGFFEWKRIKGKKQKDKYLIRLPGAPMLYMAGLYNLYKQPDGTEVARFVILTTAANESVSKLHERMPVIITENEIDEWISDGDKTGHILLRRGPELVLEKVL